MEIIDAHAHIYPEKIAEKATEAIGKFYGIEMDMPKGTTDKLLLEGAKAGISKYVVHSCATKSKQVRAINEFIKSEMDAHSEFIGFMTLHQDMTEEEVYHEVNWAIENGFKGIKLHPDFQKFYIDEENVLKFYRVVGDKLPILMHMGDNRYDFSQPQRLLKVAKEFKNVRFIGAHFGGYRCWDQSPIYKGMDNIFFDTSSSLPFIGAEKGTELINILGYDRFFFGTDFPMWDAVNELKRFNELKISDDKKEQILSKNIRNLLNI